MELVYLWVEKYKNIKNQGFNFSPRFRCSYDGENLTIDEKKDYVSIFPENINVTAIVGENGSGKSNLLEIIYGDNLFISFEFYLFVEIEEKIKCFYCKRNPNNTTQSILIKTKDIEINKKIKVSSLKNTNNKITNLTDFGSILYSESHKVNYHQEFKTVKDTKRIFLLETEIYLNYRYKSIKNTIKLVKDKNINFNQLFDLPKGLIVEFNQTLQRTNNDFCKCIKEYLNKKKIEEKIVKDFVNICKNFSTGENSPYPLVYIDIEEKYNEVLSFIKSFEEIIKITEEDFLTFNFQDLSSGQFTYLFQFANVYYYLQNIQNNNIFLCIDEGENTLHPNWQKKYVNYWITFFKNNFKDKNIHIIFSTHSPFLISDLPKENVIFLRQGEDRNCKNVTKETDINPFGANIHTLLSDGFFMSDGLMGEFAKDKIEEIKTFYDENKDLKKDDTNFQSKKDEFENKKKDFENIHKIIGEPFLKTVIGNYLDELHLILSDDKTLIEKELKELEDRKKYLESLKND